MSDEERIDHIWMDAAKFAGDVAYRALTERNELRAILAPLLDDPWDPCDGEYCVFCHEAVWKHLDNRKDEMTPNCPTHEPTKSRLLGRIQEQTRATPATGAPHAP